jgi:hypothetical protein
MRQRRNTRKRGGSGLRISLSGLYGKKQNAKTHKLIKRPHESIHPNLTNANLENLHVVNTSTNEWKIRPGNGPERIPNNLRPYPRKLKTETLGPGVRVYTARAR